MYFMNKVTGLFQIVDSYLIHVVSVGGNQCFDIIM